MSEIFSRLYSNTKRVLVIAKDFIKDFFVGLYNNAEGVVVLSLASIGLSALLGELPFWITMPMWIEAPMVIPVIAVFLVWLIVKLMEYRQNRRIRVVA